MTFEGFPPPTKNFFSLPNEMINVIAHIDNMAELKVIIYVIRHTWGYQEYGITKAITVEEFMHGRKRQDGTRMDEGTGLKSDRSVKDGLKAAIDHGFLLYEIDDTDLARIKKSYALKMASEAGRVDTTPQVDENRQVDATPLAGSIYLSGVQNLPLRQADSTPRSEKDTLEKHLKKDTLERQEGANALTRADISQQREIVEKRITHPRIEAVSASMLSDSQRLSETEEEPPLIPPRLTLPSKDKIGATHANTSRRGDTVQDHPSDATDWSDSHTDNPTHSSQGQVALSVDTSEHTPGTVQASRSLLLDSEPAQAAIPPAAGSVASGVPTAQASGDHVTPASNIPKRPKLKSDPREVQGRIDAYRGYALEEKVEIIRERQSIRTWCSLHEIGDFDLVLHYLTTVDKYWKLDENKHRIGGVTLAKETPKALASLSRKEQKAQAPPQGYADNDYSPKAQLWRQEQMARSAK